jgi:hypothetical protein
MIRGVMRRRVAVLIGLALAGAQAGHLTAYQVRFGAAAQQLQSSGAHAYFPAEVKTALGLAGLVLLASLLLIAVARTVARGVRVRTVESPSYLSLLAMLFTVQLACFVAQEVAEAAVAGARVDSAATLMLWGTIGQLPAAALLAAALRWLWTRVEEAIGQLRAVAPAWRPVLVSAPLAFLPIRSEGGPRWTTSRSPQSRRGPPHSS